MTPQCFVKLCWILHCSTTTLLGLAGQISKFCGPDKNFWGLFSIFRAYMHRGVAHALGKARPHGRPGRRGAGRRSGLRPYPPLGATRSFSIVAPSPRANSPSPTPSRPLSSPSIPFPPMSLPPLSLFWGYRHIISYLTVQYRQITTSKNLVLIISIVFGC